MKARYQIATCLVLAELVLLIGCALGQSKEKKAGGDLMVTNETGKETTLTPAVWKKLPRKKVTVKGREGGKLVYGGVALVDVLRQAGVPFGKHLRGSRLANYVLLRGEDGYQALFALAEIDPSVSDQVILMADRREGKALSGNDGPYRIVVPHDKIRSRWVKQVTKIWVRSAGKKKPE
jgi:hypothetical protein